MSQFFWLADKTEATFFCCIACVSFVRGGTRYMEIMMSYYYVYSCLVAKLCLIPLRLYEFHSVRSSVHEISQARLLE